MAPYLDQSEIAPRESEDVEERLAGFEPLDSWGKVSQGWSMPPFRSEPSDPRTWTAGKMIAQIPPVAGWRELFSVTARDAEDAGVEARVEGTLVRENATAEALRMGDTEPRWTGVAGLIPSDLVLENRLRRVGRLAATMRPHALPADAGEVQQAGAVGGELDVALPHPDSWTWTPSMAVPQVPMPEAVAAKLEVAGATGMIGWEQAEGTVQRPAQIPVQGWISLRLVNSGPSLGWDATTARAASDAIGLDMTVPDGTCFVRPLIGLELRTDATTALPEAGPLQWSKRLTLQQDGEGLAGPLEAAAADSKWQQALPDATKSLRRKRLVPGFSAALRATVRLAKPPEEVPAERTEIRQVGPVKYSPVGIVVMPPPQFALRSAGMNDEQRYVAQVPNGVWRLPRVRHSGYRALGPFPKLPLRVPDGYLQASTPEMAPVVTRMRVGTSEARQDVSGIPQFGGPEATRIHPADYLAWPQPKALKLGKMLPERVAGPEMEAPIKRFGPGRAGLQSRRRTADGLARA